MTGTAEELGASRDVRRPLDDLRQPPADQLCAGQRVPVALFGPLADVQRLGGVRERVQRGAHRLGKRQVERQLRLVDDRVQPRSRAAAAQLPLRVADAEEPRPLRAGVRRRDRDERQAARRGGSLGGVDRAAAADGDDRVDALRNLDPVRRDLFPPVGGVEDFAPARAGDDERALTGERGKLVEPPATIMRRAWRARTRRRRRRPASPCGRTRARARSRASRRAPSPAPRSASRPPAPARPQCGR